MAYMVADRKPDPVERIFNQRPDYRDPRQMPINIKEAALPGLSKEDIRVSMNGDVLTIYVPTEEEKTAKSKQEDKAGQEAAKQTEQLQGKQEDPDAKYHRQEIVKVYRPRPIRLPQDANKDNIKAEYTDGILTIIIMRDPAKTKKRSINVQ